MTGDDLTSIEAAAEFGLNPSTTRNAAAAKRVAGARPEPRPGAINAPWVASRDAWLQWFENRTAAGRPKHTTEVRNPPGGFTAVIGPYRTQQYSSHNYGPCQFIEIVRDHETPRETTWASGYLHPATRWEPTAKNKIGGIGAYSFIRPTPENVDDRVAELLAEAKDSWRHAQGNIWVIAVDDQPVGMVMTPISHHAIADATACGTTKPIPERTDHNYIEVVSLREAWTQFGNPEWEDYTSRVQSLLISLVTGRTYDLARTTGQELSPIRFREGIGKIKTLGEFLKAARAALAWMQSTSPEWPEGVETGDDYRLSVWGPHSHYSQPQK